MFHSPVYYIALTVIILLTCAVAPPLLAGRKGYAWYFWALACGPIGLVVLAFLPNVKEPHKDTDVNKARRTTGNVVGIILTAIGFLSVMAVLFLGMIIAASNELASNDASRRRARESMRPVPTRTPPVARAPAEPTRPQPNLRYHLPKPDGPHPFSPPELSKLELPVSTSPGQSVMLGLRPKKDIKLTYLTLRSEKILNNVVWAPQGDAFFVLTKDGVLSRVALQDFMEVQRLDLARRCNYLAISGAGLLVALSDLPEIWVIDPLSFGVKARIPTPTALRILSGPNLNFAVATSRAQSAPRSFGDVGSVTFLDLASQNPVHVFYAPIKHAQLSPDGKFYFAEGAIEQLCGYRIEEHKLIEHQTTARIASNGQCICVSPDNMYVCLPSGGGNSAGYSTHIYSVNNLGTPEFVLTSGAYPRLVAFDPKSKAIYAQNSEKQLLVYSTTGVQVSEHALTIERAISDDPRQFAVHPDGRKLLVVTQKHVVFVER